MAVIAESRAKANKMSQEEDLKLVELELQEREIKMRQQESKVSKVQL